jgi:hypothetical protein
MVVGVGVDGGLQLNTKVSSCRASSTADDGVGEGSGGWVSTAMGWLAEPRATARLFGAERGAASVVLRFRGGIIMIKIAGVQKHEKNACDR